MGYKEKSRLHGIYTDEFLSIMVERVNKSQISEKSAKAFIAGMKEANDEKQRTAQPLLIQHQKYADDMMAYLNFMHTNRAAWALVDEGVSFDDTSLNAELNAFVSSLTATETKLNQMTQGN